MNFTVPNKYAYDIHFREMGRKKDLTEVEKQKIHSLFREGYATLEIAKKLGRDHRTVQCYFNDGKLKRNTRKIEKNKGLRTVSERDLRKIRLSLARNPHATSKKVFEDAGVPNIAKTTRCRLLKTIGKVKKPTITCPLNPRHKVKRLEWVTKNLKTDFSKVLFTDECRANLDGPDSWASGWVLNNQSVGTRMRRQQGGGGVMFWAGIIGDKVVGPYKVEKGVKLDSDGYCKLLDEAFFPWYKTLKNGEKRKFIFQQDNAPSHVSNKTMAYLKKKGISENKIMDWPANSPDLNPIENYWGILKRQIYEGGRQFSSLNDLWEAVKDAANSVPPSMVLKLTSSMDNRLLELQAAKGGRIKR